MVSGAICGYHALKKEFLFGEYQTVVSLDQLESVTWKNSVQVKEILFCIQQVIETVVNLNNRGQRLDYTKK